MALQVVVVGVFAYLGEGQLISPWLAFVFVLATGVPAVYGLRWAKRRAELLDEARPV
jgi:hypothetical protein